MDSVRSSPAVLLHHDGELADVRALLDELGAAYVERLGAGEEHEPTQPWDVIIGSPRRILHFRPCESGPTPTLIAILDGDSRTLRAHLRRIRVSWMVRRPVHPAALRLLVLHALYRGPERRRRRRVSVGADVRIGRGLVSRVATMTDFSLRGCRLLGHQGVARGKRVKLQLPGRVTGDRPLRIKATVIRSGPASRHDPGLAVMALKFDEPTPRQVARLQRILDTHARGPAMLDSPQADAATRPATLSAASTDDAAVDTATASPSRTEACENGNGSSTASNVERAPVADEPTGDRRRDDRHAYDRRVVALGEHATRVLLGRDISVGGMRIDANPAVGVGDHLRVALHAGSRSEPLVVESVVQRDDLERGLVLRFEEPDAETRAALESLIEDLPITSGPIDEHASEDAEVGVVLSEIVEREAV